MVHANNYETVFRFVEVRPMQIKLWPLFSGHGVSYQPVGYFTLILFTSTSATLPGFDRKTSIKRRVLNRRRVSNKCRGLEATHEYKPYTSSLIATENVVLTLIIPCFHRAMLRRARL